MTFPLLLDSLTPRPLLLPSTVPRPRPHLRLRWFHCDAPRSRSPPLPAPTLLSGTRIYLPPLPLPLCPSDWIVVPRFQILGSLESQHILALVWLSISLPRPFLVPLGRHRTLLQHSRPGLLGPLCESVSTCRPCAAPVIIYNWAYTGPHVCRGERAILSILAWTAIPPRHLFERPGCLLTRAQQLTKARTTILEHHSQSWDRFASRIHCRDISLCVSVNSAGTARLRDRLLTSTLPTPPSAKSPLYIPPRHPTRTLCPKP